MKKTIAFFLIIPCICSGQIKFDFENQGAEAWIKSRASSWDTSSVEPVSGRYSLKHIYDNSEAGHDQASFCIDSLHPEAGTAEWQFTVRHEYDPSSSNNWAVFLLADIDATLMFPSGKISGYAAGVNYSGSDDFLKLWKIKNDVASVVINTGMNWQETVGFSAKGIKVTRSQDGAWEIFAGSAGSGYNKIGEGTDKELMDMMSFGIYYEYSAKQDCKLWLDDILISGVFIKDTVPPLLADLTVTGSNTLRLTFSEPLDTNHGISPADFYAGEYLGYPARISTEAPGVISLLFDSDFPEAIKCTLSIEGVSDLKGNLIKPSETEFVYYQTGWFDIIINEIMADPSPPMGLPESEYIELFNRSDHEVCMTGWSVSCGSLRKTFPEVRLKAGEYLLLVHEDAVEEFSISGKILPVFSSHTSLPNSASCIELKNENGRIISWTEYSDEWFDNEYYREGGWSLEKVDPGRFCAGSENWKRSVDPMGGTPGRKNSMTGIVPDTIHPVPEYIEIPSESTVRLYFSEPMDSTSLLNLPDYQVNPEVGSPSGIELSGPEYKSVLLIFDQPISPGIIYKLKISANLKDCAGNDLESSDSIMFAKPEPAGKEDILISEIMFDPLPGYSEFIEIYNNSSKTIDLSNIIVAEKDPQSGGLLSFTSVCQTHRLFYPGYFCVIVKNKSAFLTGYPEAGGIIFEPAGLFSLDDEQGTIVILDKWLQTLDEFTYDDNMHFPLLGSTEGVSLERISYDVPAVERDNWHSAAKDAGFCTPGYKNSQYITTSASAASIGVEPEIFTPDNDGRKDFTSICYTFSDPGNVLDIWVFDPMGRLIRRLAVNLLSGTSGCVVWDGTDDNGRRAQMGIYLIYIRIFDLNGKVSQVKKTCVLSIRK